MAAKAQDIPEQPAEPTYRVAVDLLSHKPLQIPRGAIVNGLLPDDVLAGCIARGEVVADGAEAPAELEAEAAPDATEE